MPEGLSYKYKIKGTSLQIFSIILRAPEFYVTHVVPVSILHGAITVLPVTFYRYNIFKILCIVLEELSSSLAELYRSRELRILKVLLQLAENEIVGILPVTLIGFGLFDFFIPDFLFVYHRT